MSKDGCFPLSFRFSCMKQTALVTGASGGIGLELARSFAKRGYDLVLAARNREKLETLAAELKSAHGVSVRVYQSDLSEAAAPQALFGALQKDGITVDVLVNNAGVGLFGPFAETDPQALAALVRLNVDSLTMLTRLFLPGMLERNRGRVLNVASTAAFQPGPFMSAYYASKAYVLLLSEAIDEELRGTEVFVTTLCPGPTISDFAASAGMKTSGFFDRKWLKIMSAEEVAEVGVEALLAGKRLVIAGRLNRVMAFSNRFVSRMVAARIVRNMQERRIF